MITTLAGKSFLTGDKAYTPDLHRYQVMCGIVAGRVYVAESETGEALGAAIWFGPGQELLRGYVDALIRHAEPDPFLRQRCTGRAAENL